MKICAVKVLDISEEILYKLSLSLGSEKKCKIEKFINKKDKIRTIMGEILIRTIITEEFGIKNKHIVFEKNKYGKPYLKEHEKINFNISHSGDFVVCVIDDKPVGIDIEKVKYIDCKDIIKNFFTISEFDYIAKSGSYVSLSKFYEIWTLKESYIKCLGQGLTIPLKSFSIDINEDQNIKIITDNEYNEYTFKRFDIGFEYKIAVCSVNKEILNNIIMIDQNRLINKYLAFSMEKVIEDSIRLKQ